MTSNQRTKHKGTAHLQNRKTYRQNGRRKTEHSWQTKNPITKQNDIEKTSHKIGWPANTLNSHHQKKAGQRGRQGERQQPELIKRKPAKNKHPNNKEASCNYQNSSTLNIELLMRFGMLFRLSLNLSSKKVYHSIIPTSRSV